VQDWSHSFISAKARKRIYGKIRKLKSGETMISGFQSVPDVLKNGAPGAIPTRGLPLRSPIVAVKDCFTRFQNIAILIDNRDDLMLPVRQIQGGFWKLHGYVCLESGRGVLNHSQPHARLPITETRPDDYSYERTSMPRQRTGSIFQRPDGSWWARVTFKDETGKRREKKRRAANITEAKKLRNALLRELEDHGAVTLLADRMTFAQLADHYDKEYLIPPEYRDDVKITGLRDHHKMRSVLNMLKAYFGTKLLRSITYADVKALKLARLRGTTRRGSVRAIATVNRELSLLRRVFHIAMRHGWLLRDPFKMGEPLISTADEKPRERVVSKEEEERLLAACTDRRSHLRAIIICAIDTGMRKGEMFKLRWRDIDRANGLINIVAFNTKTMRSRIVPLTERLTKELDLLWSQSTENPDALVFGIKDDVKHSFQSARLAAGLPDVRMHDLRHSFATRLIESGLPDTMVQKILGHTQPKTTRIYVNVQVSTVQRAASLLDEFNEERKETIN
jgi:integrase